ncbi:MAG TPA: ATP-binding protein [Gemmatimonadaceae bacterium]|nr:ATP-binding protein [Gemmatimonadaceae bacterium]
MARSQSGVAWWWLATVAAALIGLALWLRTPTVAWLGLALLAAVLALAGAIPGRAGPWGAMGALVLALALILAGVQQRQVLLTARQWETWSRNVGTNGAAALERAILREVVALREAALAALEAPADPPAAFAHLARVMTGAPGYRGLVLEREGAPVAWSGDLRAAVETSHDTLGVTYSMFYTTIFAVAEGEAGRAVATAIVHAEPPADRLTRSLDAAIARASRLRGFAYLPPARSDSAWHDVSVAGQRLLTVRPLLLDPGAAQVRAVERARLFGTVGMALAILVLMGVAWQRPSSLLRRFLALGVLLIVVALVPLSALSNVSAIFDPGVYYAPFGGPFTANVAALAATSAIVLLAFFALARSRIPVPSRWPAVLAVLLVASLGPFLLRDLARGIVLPLRGAPLTLWLAWQLALFLAAAAMLLGGASAGRVALGGSRGLTPWIAPALAAAAALLAPTLWEAPGRWPGWYPVIWIAAMASLALARRSRTLVVSVAVVAACGATTLVWGAVARERVQLAQSDAARLTRPDPSTRELIEHFAGQLAAGPPPVGREELLLEYVRSPLAVAGNPLEIASWLPGETRPHAELVVADFVRRPEGERGLVVEARATGHAVWRTDQSAQGVQTLVAVPHAGGGVTTVVVAPRTLLIPEDPFTLLLGLAPRTTAEPPYDVMLTTLPSTSPISEQPRWVREGNELHGDWRVPGAGESARVHVEVDLRGLDALVPRGALIVLLDLVVLGLLWTLVATSDGGLGRWVGQRVRRWRSSYRGRITLTLFAFFVIPAGFFALWSYRRLLQTDRESRVLLVRETLRTVTTSDTVGDLREMGARYDTPLFQYGGGRLDDASDALYLLLAPVGRFLPPTVAIDLGVESEVLATERPMVAGAPMLFGYRTEALPDGRRVVLAAPARMNERALDRQRRDIGILVLFITSLGALAALVLSGIAARELERPVGALRRAALRVARGEPAPELPAPPAAEFVPVFSAFERMDADLRSSRAALEQAQRRTEAVLRNVASGVIATDAEGRVTIANPGAEGVLGRPVRAGATLAELGAPILHERTVAFLAAGAADEEPFDLLLGNRQFRASLTRLGRGGGGAVLTVDDVTDLARAQRVLAWGEMARQVAHEIKNPLTPIRLGVQHLRRARGDARVDFDRVFEQNVSRILEEIDRLDEIARSFSRYGTAPQERASPVPVDVAAIVRDVVELERLGESDVAWRTEGVDEPATALAHDSELREVLLNLLENARQARARHVTVAVARRDGHVDLSVVDDGDGIPADILSHVFEPHFSTRTSGSGLGLAISRGLVTAWGGEMHVRSESGRGTELRITLAAAPAA